MKKKLMFLFRHPPYGSSLSQDGLDAAMAASLFDQEITLVFMESGVYQCIGNQQSDGIGRKSLSKQLNSLWLYDISSVYIHQESMDSYLTPDIINKIDTSIFSPITSTSLHGLINEQDHVLSF